jgi:hypothetical protein
VVLSLCALQVIEETVIHGLEVEVIDSILDEDE